MALHSTYHTLCQNRAALSQLTLVSRHKVNDDGGVEDDDASGGDDDGVMVMMMVLIMVVVVVVVMMMMMMMMMVLRMVMLMVMMTMILLQYIRLCFPPGVWENLTLEGPPPVAQRRETIHLQLGNYKFVIINNMHINKNY